MKKIKVLETSEEKPDIFNRTYSNFILIGCIIVIISTLFFKIGFLGFTVKAHDTEQWRYASQQTIEYNKTHANRAMWTDNLFSGMPTYLLTFPAHIPFLNTILINSKFINWRVCYMIFGAIGMYILLIYLKFSPLTALFSALSFALSSHFIGLLEIGHNTKFRAIMYIPWIFLCFEDMRRTRKLLSLGLLCIFLIDQLRANHFQISYYTYGLLFIYWIFYFVKSFKEKKLQQYMLFTMMIIIAYSISFLAVANPYLSSYEYSHYTIRGGSEGVGKEYATGWSFGIGETLSFIIPHFFGGISPYYWGSMPFTQTFMYMGILVFFFAILASVYLFKETKIKALLIISFIVLLISFGKHLPFLSNFLLSFLPLFNKFRVPAMILVIIQFCFPILAAYGLKLCIDKKKQNDEKFRKTTLYSFLGSLIIFIVFISVGDNFINSLSFVKGDEISQYTPGQINHLKSLRYELFIKSGLYSFAILSMGLLIIWVYLKGWMKTSLVLLFLICLNVFDLTRVNRSHFKSTSLIKESSIQKEFHTQLTDNFLLEDKDLFRIYPFHEFTTSRWSYYHQTIGGYHGAKLGRYQDLIDGKSGCLYAELTAGIPINWNFINMLNVKYIIFNNRVNIPNSELEFKFHDRETNNFIYLNNNHLPRAWFVKSKEIIPDKNKIVLRLNDPDFNPKYSVILEDDIPIFNYQDDFTVNLLEKNIHYSKWETMTSSEGFLVISEMYYPAGWSAYINNEKVDIHPSNYVLRGISVPKGKNVLELKFEPEIYKISILLSMIGLSIAILITLIGLIIYYKKNYGHGLVYKIK